MPEEFSTATQVTSNPGHHTKEGKDEKTDEETLREKIPREWGFFTDRNFISDPNGKYSQKYKKERFKGTWESYSKDVWKYLIQARLQRWEARKDTLWNCV